MNDEILEKWKEKTKGLFHLVEWTRFWNYITNLQQENERLTNELNTCMIERNNFLSRIEKAVEYIEKSKEINYKTIDTLSEEVKLLKGILNGENVMLNNILNILNGRSDE